MKLFIQPDDGVSPLIKAISRAKRSIEIIIFRLDQREVERALAAAVSRGVSVHALIAHTNRAGEDNLRKLEMRLLGQGITVARTADDLVRYHAKMMLIDRRELFLLAFNLTHQDLDRTRSFGIVTRSRDLVREAGRLFEADVKRHPYEAASDWFIVSPLNARKQLSAFLKGAKKQLLIYDPEVSDPGMLRVLEERAKSGVDVRIIGKARKTNGLAVQKLSMRLHTRTIIRDGKSAFIGSQSLRQLELDSRREVGVIFRDGKIVARLAEVFQQDWEQKAAASNGDGLSTPAARVAKKVAKAVAQDLPPVTPMLNQAVREVVGTDGKIELDDREVESAVKDAVKEAVREAVKEAVEGAR
jgi:phosphatidylserine/phosphatidylglycerophosphate/cardiolipin synthase-like enzyme